MAVVITYHVITYIFVASRQSAAATECPPLPQHHQYKWFAEQSKKRELTALQNAVVFLENCATCFEGWLDSVYTVLPAFCRAGDLAIFPTPSAIIAAWRMGAKKFFKSALEVAAAQQQQECPGSGRNTTTARVPWKWPQHNNSKSALEVAAAQQQQECPGCGRNTTTARVPWQWPQHNNSKSALEVAAAQQQQECPESGRNTTAPSVNDCTAE
jgi:hypothetical protein